MINELIKSGILSARYNVSGTIKIQKMFSEWLSTAGFPTYFDGSTHPLANNCKRFARNISFETGKKVRLVDESYTSVLSKGNDQDDARAAALILQVVLDELFYANK